jgi:hypothetical protein
LLVLPAQAADVVYPPGSRIGFVPPPGLSPSQSFVGFEDRDNRVAIVMVALPARAFGEIEQSTTPEQLKKQGLTAESREEMNHPLGKAILVIGTQQIESITLRKWILAVSTNDITALVTVQIPEAAQARYPEATVRAALMTLAVRTVVPNEEQLTRLPFRVTELAGFKVGGVLAGRALMLTDGVADKKSTGVDTHMVIAVALGGPAKAAERASFARDVFSTIPNLKDVRIESSETLRIGGQQGHQIIARGKDGASGQDITVIQWLRFGGGAYLHYIGVAQTDAWPPAYARFRQVRDGIETR